MCWGGGGLDVVGLAGVGGWGRLVSSLVYDRLVNAQHRITVDRLGYIKKDYNSVSDARTQFWLL